MLGPLKITFFKPLTEWVKSQGRHGKAQLLQAVRQIAHCVHMAVIHHLWVNTRSYILTLLVSALRLQAGPFMLRHPLKGSCSLWPIILFLYPKLWPRSCVNTRIRGLSLSTLMFFPSGHFTSNTTSMFILTDISKLLGFSPIFTDNIAKLLQVLHKIAYLVIV